jgi:hypothetical protein
MTSNDAIRIQSLVWREMVNDFVGKIGEADTLR